MTTATYQITSDDNNFNQKATNLINAMNTTSKATDNPTIEDETLDQLLDLEEKAYDDFMQLIYSMIESDDAAIIKDSHLKQGAFAQQVMKKYINPYLA